MSDDDDIYADLSTINIVNAEPKVDEEKVKLQSLLEEKEQELNEIRESRNALEKEKKTLEENISSLFKTAVNELKKKDAVIAELTRQKDTILFRRGKRHNLDDTNRNMPNTSQVMYSKQLLIANDEAKFKSVIEPSCTQKTSKCVVLSANATSVKLLNKEDTSSDNSSVKSSTKYSGSKVDVPPKGVAEGNCERRSVSSDRCSKERYSSHNKRSSRSSYNQHISSRWCNGEKRGEEERSKDLSRHRNSSQEDRKRQRYNAEEDYRERFHSRSHLRSTSPKRSRRESSCERYYDWRKRSSRSSYKRLPPSDSVRVAAQVKSKYSRVDHERSLSRTPVKKQKCEETDVVDSSSELVHKYSVVSELNSTNTEEKESTTYGDHVKNLLTLPKCILGPKDIDVDAPIGVAPGARWKDDTFPLCKSPRAKCDGKDVLLPSDKLTIDNRTGISSSGASLQIKEHRNRNGVNSNVMKHNNKSKINEYTILDSLSYNAKIISTEKEIHKNNTRGEGDAGRKTKSINNVPAGEGESKEVSIKNSDGGEQELQGSSSTKAKENSRGNSSEKKKVRRTMLPPVSLLDKCTDIEQQRRISKYNKPNTPASSVNECSGSQIPSHLPEAQEDTATSRTPSSNRANQGTGFRSSPALRTPPLKATVPLKVSPSFEDPAVVKEHKFSYVVFNEQCDFQRPKRKRSIRLSGGSCGNGSGPSINIQCKSDSKLSSKALDKETCSGKREDHQRILTMVNRSAVSDDVIMESETCSATIESCQKKLFGEGYKATDPCNVLLEQKEENTKQTLASNKPKHSDKKSVPVSDTSATSLLTRNDEENISPTISGNLEINERTDIVSVEVSQNNPSEELEADICPAKEECVSSTSLDVDPRGSGSQRSEEGREKAVSTCEAELGKRVSENRKLLREQDTVPESDENTGLGLRETRKPSSDKSDTVSANETLKLESGSNKSKPKVQRTIIVSKFRRKAANFQDSPTSVLTQVKSSTKCLHPEVVALLDYKK